MAPLLVFKPQIISLLKDTLNLNELEIKVLLLIRDVQRKDSTFLSTITNDEEKRLFTNKKLLQKGLSIWELQQILNLDFNTVCNVLNTLKERDFINHMGSKGFYRYQPISKNLESVNGDLANLSSEMYSRIAPLIYSQYAGIGVNCLESRFTLDLKDQKIISGSKPVSNDKSPLKNLIKKLNLD